jgi:hypothetical protein
VHEFAGEIASYGARRQYNSATRSSRLTFAALSRLRSWAKFRFRVTPTREADCFGARISSAATVKLHRRRRETNRNKQPQVGLGRVTIVVIMDLQVDLQLEILDFSHLMSLS